MTHTGSINCEYQVLINKISFCHPLVNAIGRRMCCHRITHVPFHVKCMVHRMCEHICIVRRAVSLCDRSNDAAATCTFSWKRNIKFYVTFNAQRKPMGHTKRCVCVRFRRQKTEDKLQQSKRIQTCSPSRVSHSPRYLPGSFHRLCICSDDIVVSRERVSDNSGRRPS